MNATTLQALRETGGLGKKAADLIEQHRNDITNLTRKLTEERTVRERAEQSVRNLSREIERCKTELRNAKLVEHT